MHVLSSAIGYSTKATRTRGSAQPNVTLHADSSTSRIRKEQRTQKWGRNQRTNFTTTFHVWLATNSPPRWQLLISSLLTTNSLISITLRAQKKGEARNPVAR